MTAAEDHPVDQPALNDLMDSLFPLPSEPDGVAPEVYAVLDGARVENFYSAVYHSQLDYECLFTGNIPYDLADAAPYLVRLTREADFTRWVLKEHWGNGLGIFAWSHANLELLRRHFRRLLQVHDEQGRRLYFRYYDPRVLRVYLPTCTAVDLHEVFGPVERLLVEGTQKEVLSCQPRLKEGSHYLEWETQPVGAR